ncbi:DUF2124 domain-containing protein [Methanolobus sp. ZRKC3]|uniref:DUF2124 family protein n=1 Tax=Methanolobus sp. ZRKC3 TaxID=3125786 RepID=UPI00324A72BB
MEVVNTSKGIGGQLNDFRKLVTDSQRIVFFGSAGFCTPFAELLAFVLRNTDKELIFVPGNRLDAAKLIVPTENGMQLGDAVSSVKADTVVLLGGLSMPKIGVEPKIMKETVEEVLNGSDTKLIMGVCFQSMLLNEEWLDAINFDYVIDSDLTNELKEI